MGGVMFWPDNEDFKKSFSTITCQGHFDNYVTDLFQSQSDTKMNQRVLNQPFCNNYLTTPTPKMFFLQDILANIVFFCTLIND